MASAWFIGHLLLVYRAVGTVQVRRNVANLEFREALTPRALLHRLQRGVVYERAKAEQALQKFFRESTLVALRELALRQAAHEVEHRISNGQARASSDVDVTLQLRKHHKILVLVTPNPKTAMAIRRAKRVGDFLGAECFAITVQPSGDLSGLPESDRFSRLSTKLNLKWTPFFGPKPGEFKLHFSQSANRRFRVALVCRPPVRYLPLAG